jgi:hypothetical protein
MVLDIIGNAFTSHAPKEHRQGRFAGDRFWGCFSGFFHRDCPIFSMWSVANETALRLKKGSWMLCGVL